MGTGSSLFIIAACVVGTPQPTAAEKEASMSRQEKIVISGASGQLGRLTIAALLARGIPALQLILVTRTPEQLAEYARLGAAVRYGDFTVQKSLPDAFAGGTRMLLISVGPDARPRPRAHQNAIDAAIAVGIRQIAYTSYVAISHGETTGLATDHYQTEEILKKSGLAWTMLRNSIYSDILLPEAAEEVARGLAIVPADDSPVGYVTRADCAAAAAAVLTTSGHEFRAYDITGPELVSQRDIALTASAVTGKNIDIVVAGSGEVLPDPGFGGPAIAVTSNDVAKLTGRAPTTLRTLFEANRAQLLRQ